MENTTKSQSNKGAQPKEKSVLTALLSAQEEPITASKHLFQEAHDVIVQKTNRIQFLEEYIRVLKQKQFGSSSEKIPAEQLALVLNEAESAEEESAAANTTAEAVTTNAADAVVTVEAHQGRQKRVSIPEHLPREEIVYDLFDAEKICPHDGAALKLIGREEHEQVDIIPAQVKVLRHVRLKYVCTCCESYVVTAKKRKQPIEKSIAASGLLACVAVQKYADGLPLYRQNVIFNRAGIDLDRTTLANWMVCCGRLIQPLINLIHERMLEQKQLHMDETCVQVLNEPGKSAQSQSYMWVLRSAQEKAKAVLFHYAPTRSGDVAKELLQSYNQALMVDGYEGYSAGRQCWVKLCITCKANGRG